MVQTGFGIVIILDSERQSPNVDQKSQSYEGPDSEIHSFSLDSEHFHLALLSVEAQIRQDRARHSRGFIRVGHCLFGSTVPTLNTTAYCLLPKKKRRGIRASFLVVRK